MNTQVVGFKKIKFHTHENVGAGNLTLPEQEMHSTAWWLTLPHEMLETLPYSSTDRQDGVRALGNALQAMAILLVMCDGRDLGVAVGENTRGKGSGAGGQGQNEVVRSSEFGVRSSAPGEFRVSDFELRSSRAPNPEPRAPSFEPNIYLYDKYPGGIGLSEPLYRMSQQLLNNVRKLIQNCPCEAGCPSCVGPVGEIGEKGKEVALAILEIARPYDEGDR